MDKGIDLNKGVIQLHPNPPPHPHKNIYTKITLELGQGSDTSPQLKIFLLLLTPYTLPSM